ncbi:serine/threonine protein kinase [Loa loa]|uniref:Serine/threonine protein kinase n=1 Tax=Loa loa TaxID=7209 RepID=A0A1I7VT57_LOALO|nr:serine/threonine protein kinase [Loa loa]EFO27211.1 serine/threonine protein kinase [Loa loa]
MEVALRNDSFYASYGEFRLLNEQRSKKVFVGIRHSDGRYVAVKVEEIFNKRRTEAAGQYNKGERNNLEQEHAVYRNLHGRGTPHVYWFGRVDGCKAMVMDLTGPALEELFIYCNRRFSLKTVLMLADQMLDRIQTLHDAGYVHRDLTSDTFVVGIEENIAKVYLVTMKLASKYIKISGGCRKHIPYGENIEFFGSSYFASLNRHLGTVASRRDDLESYIYILLYFLKGNLPWQIYGNSNELEQVLKIKTSTSIETLCHGLPTEFATVLNYCRTLKFEDKPDYLFIRQLFRDLFNSLTYKEDWNFDWMSRYCSKQH